MTIALKLESLKYSHRNFDLGPVNFAIESGRVVGLVGPNGSGKSTLINCLAGFLYPSGGRLIINGDPINLASGSWKLKTAYAGESSKFFERWTVEKNLDLISGLYPGWSRPYMLNLLNRLKLDGSSKARDLSRGNRMKLALVAALAYKPELLLFDEPADGLDPEIRGEMLAILREIMQEGKCTILMVTHHLEEFSSLVDEMIFLREGKIELQQEIDLISDRWSILSFSAENFDHKINSVVHHKTEGKDHRMISSNKAVTENILKNHGINKIQKTRMDLDEILKWMVRGDKNVVTGQG